MRPKHALTVSIVALCLLIPLICNAQDFSKSAELTSIKMSYSDLDNLLKKTENFISTANGELSSSSFLHSLAVSNEQDKFTQRGDLSNVSYQSFPSVGFKLNYDYYARDKPISRVELWFTDSQRRINVEGSRPDQVEALFALIQTDLGRQTTLFGGSNFRLLLFLILVLLSATLSVVLPKLRTKTVTNIAISFVLLALWLSMMFFPYDEWLPGFAIYSGSASFASRHSAELTLLGVILAVVIPLLQSVISRSKKRSVPMAHLQETLEQAAKSDEEIT